jgi:hypothetical protein
MASTQVNPNVNLTENILVLDTNALVTGEVTFVSQDVVVSGTASQIIFVGTPGGEGSTYAGVQYRDSSHNNRYGLSFQATDVVALGNRAANGVVRITANAAAGAGGEVIAAEFQDDQLSLYTKVKQAVFELDVADNSATTIFTITTTNESGNNDGGVYTCFVDALAMTSYPAAGAGATAVRGFKGSFSRAIMNTGGTGVNTAVTEIYESASAATTAATRDVNAVTMTVSETSEYVQAVQFTVDVTGTTVGTPHVLCFVTLLWTGFTTPPVLAQA